MNESFAISVTDLEDARAELDRLVWEMSKLPGEIRIQQKRVSALQAEVQANCAHDSIVEDGTEFCHVCGESRSELMQTHYEDYVDDRAKAMIRGER